MKRENVWRKRLEECIARAWVDSLVLKMHVGVMDSSGKPDIYVSVRYHGSVWLELKYVEDGQMFDWDEQPSKIQKDCIRKLYYAGSRVGVIVFFENEWRSIHGAELIDVMNKGGLWTKEHPLWNPCMAFPARYEQLKTLVFGR